MCIFKTTDQIFTPFLNIKLNDQIKILFFSGIEPMNLMINRFCNDQRGASAVEYGIIITLIALVVVVGIQNTSSNLSGIFNKVKNNL